MFLCTQYYRPPFPERAAWADDMSRIRDAGIHAVQLWYIWGWVEAEPGVYRYDDYDRLVGLAERRGLKVVLSTIAEIHPFWIHRLVPGSEMVDHLGRKVISCCRCECNIGLTPGGCFDHPPVAELMGAFLTDASEHYRGTAGLIGWDCWNETRWAVHADGNVCYCPSTLAKFRRWLGDRHGGLEGLNAAWKRRYVNWNDVYPAKRTNGTYVDVMDFLRFLADRAARHARFRYDAIRSADKKHMISAHSAGPATHSPGGGTEQALCRGVDWDLADNLDGWGCSQFPLAGGSFEKEHFGVRLESARSAARGKTYWISELQGGAARQRIAAYESVPADVQQQWVAQGMARGAGGVIFWCWADERFGRESGGYGLVGWDGLAQERLAAMRKTSRFINANARRLDGYRPDAAEVGVLFVPDSYFLKWADEGNAAEAADAVIGYAVALEALRIPYDIVEAHHLDALKELKVLLMPWPLVVPPEARRAIVKFVRAGGRILAEAEADAFDELGFFRHGDERPLMKALGVGALGRRVMGESGVVWAEIGGRQVELPAGNFLTPLKAPAAAEVLAANERGEPLMLRRALGQGGAFIVGAFLGRPYLRDRNPGLERLIRHVCDDAGAKVKFDVDAGDGNEGLVWRSGRTDKGRLLWIINSGPQRSVTVTAGRRLLGRARQAVELVGGTKVAISAAGQDAQCKLSVPAGGFAVLHW